MTSSKAASPVLAAFLLAACNGAADPPEDSSSRSTADESAVSDPAPAPEGGDAGSGNRNAMHAEPSGNLVKEGRIETGVECPVLHTPDGEIWALALGEADFGPGDYVRVTGKKADMSICQQGRGTIDPSQIDSIEPPTRDRDPGRAGGLAVTTEYVRGNWVAKGVEADCSNPDFRVSTNSNGMALFEGKVNGAPQTAPLSVGDHPAIHFDMPLPSAPVETRGPDGLAFLPPKAGRISVSGHKIVGDGVVFVKCG